MDPSGAYVVCSHSDRCMRIYNFITGEPIAEASGHAEVITGVAFLPDCRRLVSVSFISYILVLLQNHL
jgi:WD40 repeat protein